MMIRWMSIALVCLSSAGCGAVAAWDREILAEERMQLDADPDSRALVDGRRSVREEGHVGAAGSASSGAAGGCGCN